MESANLDGLAPQTGLTVCRFSNEGAIVAASANAACFLGVDQAQLAELSLFSLNAAHSSGVAELLSQRLPFAIFGANLFGIDGLRGWVQAAPLEDGWVVTIFSTEKSPLAQAFEEHMLAAIGRATGKLGHDFNNFLGSITGCTDMLQHKLNKQPGGAEPYLRQFDIINRSLKKAANLTDKMRGFVRFDPTESEKVNLREILLDSWERVEAAEREKTVLKLNCPESSMVRAPAFQLTQILRSLFENAIDAVKKSEQKEILVEVLPEETDGDTLKLTIKDYGDGTPRQLAKGLEPFVTTRPEGIGKGLGLGLPMARSGLIGMGGALEIHCAPQGETVVTIRLLKA